jgi:hypothetical protein
VFKKLIYPIALLTLTACQNVPSEVINTAATPAVLATNNTQMCYQQLSQQLAQAIEYPVHVSPTAFATTATIFLEPISARQSNGQRKNGMILDKPTQFKLELNNQQCVLSQVDKPFKSILNLCVCQAAP